MKRMKMSTVAKLFFIGLFSYGSSQAQVSSGTKANRPPVAYAGKERIAVVGEAVEFYGQGASPDREIVEYSWDFESDGLVDFVSSHTATVTHRFTEPGDYRCLLNVKDSSGQIARCVRRILVIPANADRNAAEKALHPAARIRVRPADGFIHRYAILFNGANEERFWKDMTLCYAMLTNHYGFSPSDIFLLNYDGTSPNGDNPGGMIDYPATLEGLQTVISNLATVVDSDDEVSFWITDHGRGYSGPLSEGGWALGYLDGRASVDPGDEPDFPESNFKLRSLMTGGDYLCNHGLNVWKVFRSDYGGKTAYYRNKYVSHFDNVYIETLGKSVSDHDVFIERFVDYLRGDFNRDGFIDTSIGEVFDYDGDGVPPHDPVTGKFDEDDWGAMDVLEDDFNRLNTQMPEGAWPYQLFDNNFEGKLCIDLAYDGIQLHVDGRDEDGMGLFDWMDVNQDGDTNDIISVDEGIMTYSGTIYDDDLREMLAQLSAAKITIVAEPCFSGGLVEDLSSTNRVICTATIEDAVSYGDVFIRGFIAALDGRDEYGTPVNADAEGNGAVSMLEAFNYAAAYDFFDEVPQYDDDGDGISHPWWSPCGDGSLGANTYLSGGTPVSNTVNDWVKPTSGYWEEEPYWSLGKLPAMGQSLITFRNAGWKALAIGANTTANYPNSLAINYLTVEGPADSSNQLLLNYAGLDVPLFVNSDLYLGTNASLVSYHSALRGGSFYLSAPATFSDGSTVVFNTILVGASAPAEINLINSSLSAGLLMLGQGAAGTLNQSGGSNQVSMLQMYAGSAYTLNNGDLVTSNTTVDTAACVRSDFVQNGGSHSVRDRLLLQDFVRYDLRAGTLSAPNIEVGPGAELLVEGGVISNSGVFTIRGGAVRAAGRSLQLGQLKVIGDPVLVCVGTQPTMSTLDVGFASGSGATVLRFRDSRNVPWSGSPLAILYWSPSTNGFGPDHIFVGTNSQGLTVSQLSQLTFVNPVGWPAGNYPARMLSTGEIVPGVPSSLGFTRTSNSLILSWVGDYQLVTATNLNGPYVMVPGTSSPYTNTITEPQRYFRLRLAPP